ncbi:MAG: 4Fe-4S binding protein, partial [Candidatus Poseidoniia archaeon]|nr:4Fe-4S binding protein [Candidatus Poseidoniia archaeon]
YPEDFDLCIADGACIDACPVEVFEWLDTYMMYTVACHSALRAGDKLTMSQMEFVIREMESIPNPYACVHGRPTVMTITPAELDKKFKRSGF